MMQHSRGFVAEAFVGTGCLSRDGPIIGSKTGFNRSVANTVCVFSVSHLFAAQLPPRSEKAVTIFRRPAWLTTKQVHEWVVLTLPSFTDDAPCSSLPSSSPYGFSGLLVNLVPLESNKDAANWQLRMPGMPGMAGLLYCRGFKQRNYAVTYGRHESCSPPSSILCTEILSYCQRSFRALRKERCTGARVVLAGSLHPAPRIVDHSNFRVFKAHDPRATISNRLR